MKIFSKKGVLVISLYASKLAIHTPSTTLTVAVLPVPGAVTSVTVVPTIFMSPSKYKSNPSADPPEPIHADISM